MNVGKNQISLGVDSSHKFDGSARVSGDIDQTALFILRFFGIEFGVFVKLYVVEIDIARNHRSRNGSVLKENIAYVVTSAIANDKIFNTCAVHINVTACQLFASSNKSIPLEFGGVFTVCCFEGNNSFGLNLPCYNQVNDVYGSVTCTEVRISHGVCKA